MPNQEFGVRFLLQRDLATPECHLIYHNKKSVIGPLKYNSKNVYKLSDTNVVSSKTSNNGKNHIFSSKTIIDYDFYRLLWKWKFHYQFRLDKNRWFGGPKMEFSKLDKRVGYQLKVPKTLSIKGMYNWTDKSFEFKVKGALDYSFEGGKLYHLLIFCRLLYYYQSI